MKFSPKREIFSSTPKSYTQNPILFRLWVESVWILGPVYSGSPKINRICPQSENAPNEKFPAFLNVIAVVIQVCRERETFTPLEIFPQTRNFLLVRNFPPKQETFHCRESCALCKIRKNFWDWAQNPDGLHP